jgi:hypothetical protein
MTNLKLPKNWQVHPIDKYDLDTKISKISRFEIYLVDHYGIMIFDSITCESWLCLCRDIEVKDEIRKAKEIITDYLTKIMTDQKMRATARRIIKSALKANNGIFKPNLLKTYFFNNTEYSEQAILIWQKEVKLARLLLKKTRSINKIVTSDWSGLANIYRINLTHL